jgi:hypothetical protein
VRGSFHKKACAGFARDDDTLAMPLAIPATAAEYEWDRNMDLGLVHPPQEKEGVLI